MQVSDVPFPVREIVKANDFLGFDSLGQALGAILTHSDFSERWEFDTPEELNEVEQWQEQTVSQFNIRQYA